MAALLSLLLATPPMSETVQTLDFGKVTFAEARRLDGKPVRVRFAPVGLVAALKTGETIVGADCLPEMTVCVRFAAGVKVPKLDGAVVVEGRMRARIIPPRLIDAELFPAVLDVEVMDARQVWP